MLWAAIVLPHLALDGVLRRYATPEAPLALVTGPSQRRILLAVNAIAHAAGLRPGLSLNAAHALLPQFEICAYDAAENARLLQLLAAWAYRYSSLVRLEGEDAIVLEVKASLGLFGPWSRFEHLLRTDLRALGFQHRIALAPTPLAACALATDRDGAIVTDPTRLQSALGPVPLTAARLPLPQVSACAGMGIRQLRQLLALPRAGLARRFGVELLTFLECLLGERADLRDCYRPPDAFEARLEFNYEIEHHPAILFPLKRMLGDLGTYLSRRDGGVQRFELRLVHAELPPTSLMLSLLSPTRDPNHLFELCRVRLERVTLPAPIRGLQLLARELPPFIPAMQDLFAARPNERSSWPNLRERLRARLGDSALVQWQPHADPRPEHSLRSVAQLTAEPTALCLPPRPAWLLPQPLPWRDQARQILAGPERIEAGWWDGEDVRRDYYVIETRRGQRAWVFRPAGVQEGPWMLHGWFA